MSKDGSFWPDARRAWERLASWHRDLSQAPSDDLTNPAHPAHTAHADQPGHPNQPPRPPLTGQPGRGDDALSALADIGAVRRLLDQVELDAVRAARQERLSWAEIAVRLGVSRQSAWQRWRDVDEELSSQRPPAKATGRSTRPSLRDATEALLGRASNELLQDVANQATGTRLRRRSSVVPNVVGLGWDEARVRLSAVSLIGVRPDLDSPSAQGADQDTGAVVVEQSPAAGTRVPFGSLVRLRIERGGGSAGVREPRRPAPAPKHAAETPPATSDKAAS